MNKLTLGAYGLALLAMAHLSHGASVIGATGDTNSGRFDDNSFYQIDLDTRAATYLGTASVTPNQVAYDLTTNNIYYSDHNGTNFYRFNTIDNTEHFITDLTDVGLPPGKVGSGGGDFYDGRYYYTPETGAQGIQQISFNADGSNVQEQSVITPSNLGDFSDLSDGSAFAGLGDFGDIAINNENGRLYGSSRLSQDGSTYAALWYIDLTSPDYTIVLVDGDLDSRYQLAFDEDNRLWANRFTGTSGGQSARLLEINQETGDVESQVLVRVDGRRGQGDFFDLASTNLREGIDINSDPLIIPEVSSSLLIILGAMVSLFRRSRG